ncbi:MAG: DUF4982 domain-containing protein [Rikenellaceae bacterium]|nr:DUF4982 domain-containing protein [Rikenellaceae bacterium]
MGKYILAAILLLAAGLNADAKEVFKLNRNWDFFSDTEGSSDHAVKVNLPHTWNQDALSGKKDYFRGIGHYIKEMTFPKEWAAKRIYLRVNGANSIANVQVNGTHVAEHRGGYTSFTVEITRYVKFGEKNAIWLIVNNAPQMDVLPTAGNLNSYGGLFRSVELIVTDPVHVALTDFGSDGVYINQKKVTDEEVVGEAMVKVDGAGDRPLRVTLEIMAPGRETVTAELPRFKPDNLAGAMAVVPFRIERPTLWQGEENPFLYNMAVKIFDEDRLCDSVFLRTGFRTFRVDPDRGFMLNGRPYPLRGVYAHQDRASVGNAVTYYQIREDVDLITEMGANAVRVTGYPQSSEFYDLCDRKGLIVWSDLPLIGPFYLTDRAYVRSSAFHDNARQQLVEMIRQQYNHPSIAMWGIFSDLTLRGDDPTPFVRELNYLAKQEDPSRLTVASSNQDGEINFVTDLVCWDHTLGWKEGTPEDIMVWMAQLRKNWRTLNSGLSYGAGASIYHQQDSLVKPLYHSNWHPENWQTYLHEQYLKNIADSAFFWGTFVCNMFDHGAAGYEWGEGNGIDDRGVVTFDRKYRKDAYYLYKANWNKTDPFVYVAERRRIERNNPVQHIKVYSNQPEVELVVNGRSVGVAQGERGIFNWDGVQLDEGLNLIEARAGNASDQTIIAVVNSGSRELFDAN